MEPQGQLSAVTGGVGHNCRAGATGGNSEMLVTSETWRKRYVLLCYLPLARANSQSWRQAALAPQSLGPIGTLLRWKAIMLPML